MLSTLRRQASSTLAPQRDPHRGPARSRTRWLSPTLACLLAIGLARPGAGAPESPADPAASPVGVALDSARLNELLGGAPPVNVDELRGLETRVREIAERGLRATVGLRVGNAAGSGVLIGDRLILTAAHVCSSPDSRVSVILVDGRRVRGRALGSNVGLDSGLVRLDEELPEELRDAGLQLARVEDIRDGQWCVALGHPGGFRADRPAPLRLGRVLDQRSSGLRTDCLLIGGDSGGPLLDLEGRVIGIHSRISPSPRSNIHVPIAAFHEGWDRMLASETWGGRGESSGPTAGGPWLGVASDPESPRAKVKSVVDGSPAAKAGLVAGDVIVKLGEEEIENFGALARLVRARKPGDKVRLEIERGESRLEIELEIGAFERK